MDDIDLWSPEKDNFNVVYAKIRMATIHTSWAGGTAGLRDSAGHPGVLTA